MQLLKAQTSNYSMESFCGGGNTTDLAACEGNIAIPKSLQEHAVNWCHAAFSGIRVRLVWSTPHGNISIGNTLERIYTEHVALAPLVKRTRNTVQNTDIFLPKMRKHVPGKPYA